MILIFLNYMMKLDRNFILFQLGIFIADIFDLTDTMLKEDSKSKEKTYKDYSKIYYPKFVKEVNDSQINPKFKKLILTLTDMDLKRRSKITFEEILEVIK